MEQFKRDQERECAMTTSQSPLRVLKAQADEIAKTIKAAERGESVAPQFAAKLAEAKGKENFVVGVVMDDKVLKITLPWAMIRSTSEVSLSEYILKHMRGQRESA
jgi:hypothetical protein